MNKAIGTFGMWSAVVAVGWMTAGCCAEKEDVDPGPPLEWQTSWDAAAEKAEKLDRPVFVNFTGSDWCGWCIRLHDEVFAQRPFREYSSENLVLLEIDFPQSKQLPEEHSRANHELAEKYSVLGFPTILLLDSQGAELARTGYQPGGSEAYVEHLQALLAD